MTVHYDWILAVGFKGIAAKAKKALEEADFGDAVNAKRSHFLNAVILSCEAAIIYAERYSDLARKMAEKETDAERKRELLQISENCANVPANGARSFWEACQAFWFVQQLLQIESSGHSISPGRFDQYMYPYYKADLEKGAITAANSRRNSSTVYGSNSTI